MTGNWAYFIHSKNKQKSLVSLYHRGNMTIGVIT